MPHPFIPLPRSDAPPAALIAALADRYRPVRYLASGAEATVWLARDLHDDSQVALKCCAPRPGRRALQELGSLLDLRHPRIVPLRDFRYLPSGEMILVSDYVAGGSLRERLERGPLSPAAVFDIAEDVLEALAYLHGLRLAHRDIKPDNILVSSGPDQDVHLLTDFGIAGQLEDATMGDGVVGSAAYLAPENYTRRAGPSGDLYSLGVTLHELLAGQRPFEGEGAALARAHLSAPPPPLMGVAVVLQPLVHALLAKDPRQRPADARAARALLDTLRPGRVRATPSHVWSIKTPEPLTFELGSRLVLNSSFHLSGEATPFGLTTLDGRPCLVLDQGSHLALHDATNGGATHILLPKTGGAHRLDHPGFIVRATTRAALAWDTRLRSETTLGELSGPCAQLAWHRESGRFAASHNLCLRVENPGRSGRTLRLPDGFHAPRLTWLQHGATLAAAGGLLRPELRLYTPEGELRDIHPLPGAVIDAPRANGAAIWLMIDHEAKARLCARELCHDGTWHELPLPETVVAHEIAPDGLLVLLEDRSLWHVSSAHGQYLLGMLHPDTRYLALAGDARHLLAARSTAAGAEFTLYAHLHA